jgi:hypothetical protein
MVLTAFILGSKNGYIALWRGEDPQPVKVFPYPISALPLQDQQALKNGIRLESIDELYALIEDYLS